MYFKILNRSPYFEIEVQLHNQTWVFLSMANKLKHLFQGWKNETFPAVNGKITTV